MSNTQSLTKHVKKHMIHFDNLEEHFDKFPIDCDYAFDTESSFMTEEIQEIYENGLQKEIEFEGDAVHVYSWALSNTMNDYVLYGENLHQFFTSLNKICYNRIRRYDFSNLSEKKVKTMKTNMKMRIFVHNLEWDIEFCKYYLLQNNYRYYNSLVIDGKKVQSKTDAKSFNITENKNIVYTANVNLEGRRLKYMKNVKNKQTKQKTEIEVKSEIFPRIEFLDFAKILVQKLDAIGKFINIDEMFHKKGDNYDYDRVRPKGYKISMDEMEYLYNDVYILKEAIRQFYYGLETKATTASSIAFERFIKSIFGEQKTYDAFVEHFPDLSEMPRIFEMISNSYSGGWTQANAKYKGKKLENINGTSVDINSSYPAIIKGVLQILENYNGTPLPYGVPKHYQGYSPRGENELNLYCVSFDKFYNKDKDNKIGTIQAGANNPFGVIGTEYIATNVVDGIAMGFSKHFGNPRYSESKMRRYNLYLWEYELESILKNTVFEDYEIQETLTFKCETGLFASVVDELTQMKIEGKRDKDKVKETTAKLLMNSFYGKLAGSFERLERKFFLEKGFVQAQSTDVSYLSDKRYYPAYASAVTAWARTNLRENLYKIGFNNVLYFDTDSLYTLLSVEELKEKMGVFSEDNPTGLLDKYELGKWDIEKTYHTFKTLGSKKYMLVQLNGDKMCKCAGLPDEVRDIMEIDDFNLGKTVHGKKMKVKVKGGYVLLKGDFTLHDFTFSR